MSYALTSDFDHDNDLDVAVTIADVGAVTIMRNNGSGTLQALASYGVGFNPVALAVADLNQDTHKDLVVANQDSGNITLLQGLGTGAFQQSGTISVGSQPRQLTIGDINEDGHLDLVVANYGNSSVTLLFGNSTFSFGSPATYTFTGAPASVALGDVNQDQNLDLAVALAGSHKAAIKLGNGDGTFSATSTYTVDRDPNAVMLADLTGDQTLDLITANGNGNNVSFLPGLGDGTFLSATHYSVGGNPIGLISADLNGDQRPDLAVSNFNSHSVSVLLNTPEDASNLTGTIGINSGATATSNSTVTLNLNVQNGGCHGIEMALSNDDITYTAFEPFALTKAWTLTPGDGSKTVFVKFRDVNQTTLVTASATILLDQISPTGSITINNGSPTTNNATVQLMLNVSDTGSGVQQMRLFDTLTTGAWLSFASTGTWSFAGADGTRTINVQFRDAAGNISDPISATIILDRQPPITQINNLDDYQTQTSFPITLISSDATSGVTSYDIQVQDDDGEWSDWQSQITETTTEFTGVDGHTYRFRARARDAAGNVGSYSALAETTIDTTSPQGLSFLINGGAETTTSHDVVLSLAAIDATSGVAEMSFSEDAQTWSTWQPYAAAIPWTLASGNEGVREVVVRFRDAAGNISTILHDTITLNTQIHTEYGLTINHGDLFTNQVEVTLTVQAAPRTAQMQISNDGGFAGAVWEPYNAQKSWQITQYGVSTLPRLVYVRFKDISGAVSSTYLDDIILDVTPPAGIVRIIRSHSGHTVQLSATDDLSGVDAVRVSNEPNFTGTAWQSYTSTLPWNFDTSSGVYVQFRDNAGNVSSIYQAGNYTVALPLVLR